MKSQTSKFTGILIALAILVLSSVACSFSAINMDKNGATISIDLNEDQINDLINNSTDHINDRDVILDEITSVDMQDGFIRVFGTYEKSDGSDGEGSYDLVLAAEDGELQAEITGVDIEGVELSDSRIQRINEEMEESLARSAHESNGEVEFESVKITDENFTMVVKTHWENQ